jgi:hypothetical protein
MTQTHEEDDYSERLAREVIEYRTAILQQRYNPHRIRVNLSGPEAILIKELSRMNARVQALEAKLQERCILDE